MTPEPRILTVAEASTFLGELVAPYPLAVTGEVAGFNVSQGKFVFFDLKDEQEEARLACFCMLHQLGVPLENGMRVVLHARATVFRKSGKLSLTVIRVQPVGEGSLQRAFELLKQKLEKEGLFAVHRKRALPALPLHIGVVSSQDAAGWGDFWRILQTRGPQVRVTLTPSSVQGVRAVEELCAALAYQNTYVQPEVIVLIRGGGSAEDLHAFNEEQLARAIAGSRTPVLVGVGHERDITIADLVADARASTPTAAAQLVLPEREALLANLDQLAVRIRSHTAHALSLAREQLSSQGEQVTLRVLQAVTMARRRLVHIEELVQARSPVALLAQGYTLTTSEGVLVRTAHHAKQATTLKTHFADGTVLSTPHA